MISNCTILILIIWLCVPSLISNFLDISIAVDRFKHNSFMANPNKFQFVVLGDGNEFSVAVDGIEITRCDDTVLLGVNIDCKFKFDKHVRYKFGQSSK